MEQIGLEELLYEQFIIKSDTIKCIEFFAGYGSTTLAWKYLLEEYNKVNDKKINYEHHKISEWALPSIIAYASVHRNELKDYGKDFCGDMTKEQITQKLCEMGVSLNYDLPAQFKEIKKLGIEKLKLCYNSIKWSNNLVDISKIKGEDLKIEKKDNETYFLSYSFPCQDISNAGLSKGFSKSKNGEDEYSSETRSGLLWQVERILLELKSKGEKEGNWRKYLPDVLFCENVPLIESSGDNLNNLLYWKNVLENIGYSNYSDKLQATNYGIPQTRNRFYMFSILNKENGDKWFYKFPKKIPLKLRLKDMLEDEDDVDEKYYLSEKLIQCFLSDGTGKYPRRERFLQNIGRKNQDIANSITTLAGNRPTDNFIIKETKNKTLFETLEQNDLSKIDDVAFIDGYNRNIKNDGNSCTITTRVNASNNNFIAIKNKTKKGYLLAKEGDGIDISGRMQYHRGTVQTDKAQTITTAGGENVGVVIKVDSQKYTQKSLDKIYKNIITDDLCGALTATGMQSINHDGCQLVIENNKTEIPLKRGYSCEVKEEEKETSEIDVIGNYSKSNFTQTSIVGKNGVAPTVTENHGQVTGIVVEDKIPQVIGGIGEKKSNGGTQWYQQDRIYDDNVAITVTTDLNPYYASLDEDEEVVYLRIRKLTPKECFRLQGVKDNDIALISEGQVDSKLYHLAGDSICCYGPLLAMYCQLLDFDFKQFFKKKEWWK